MRLVIDIPEEEYEICKDNEYCDISDYSKLTMLSYLSHTIKIGTPLEEELEKLKEEMWKTEPNGVSFELKYNISKLIDKHISELKGE